MGRQHPEEDRQNLAQLVDRQQLRQDFASLQLLRHGINAFTWVIADRLPAVIRSSATALDFTAANDEASFLQWRRIVRALSEHPTWEPATNVFIPRPSVRSTLPTMESRLRYIADALDRRQVLFERLEERYGSTRFAVPIEGKSKLQNLTFRLKESIDPEGNTFYLQKTFTYEMNGYRYTLILDIGEIIFDIEGDDRVWINAIQDHKSWDIVGVQDAEKGTPVEMSHLEKLTEADFDVLLRATQNELNNTQDALRGVAKERRNRPRGERKTPGVEEFALAASIALLRGAGLITEQADIVIPPVEDIYMGELEQSSVTSSLRRAVAKAYKAMPEPIKTKLIDTYGQTQAIWEEIAASPEERIAFVLLERAEVGATRGESLPFEIDGQETTLYNQLIQMVLEDIPVEKRARASEMIASQQTAGAAVMTILRCLTLYTNTYANVFYSYHAAFDDIEAVTVDASGNRHIPSALVAQLPFYQYLDRITPIQ